MRFSTLPLLATFLSATLPIVSAKCYNNDDLSIDWGGSRVTADGTNDIACYQANGAFAGTFGPGETKRYCVTYRSGPSKNDRSLFFEITNLNTGASFDLGNDDCKNRLHDEVWGCGAGGESTIAGWKFR